MVGFAGLRPVVAVSTNSQHLLKVGYTLRSTPGVVPYEDDKFGAEFDSRCWRNCGCCCCDCRCCWCRFSRNWGVVVFGAANSDGGDRKNDTSEGKSDLKTTHHNARDSGCSRRTLARRLLEPCMVSSAAIKCEIGQSPSGCPLGSHSIPESVHGNITEMVSFAEFEMLLRERYPDRNQHDTRCDPDPSAHGERFQWATALLGTASPSARSSHRANPRSQRIGRSKPQGRS